MFGVWRGVGGLVQSDDGVEVELVFEGEISSVDGRSSGKFIKYGVYARVGSSVGWYFGRRIGAGFYINVGGESGRVDDVKV